MQRSNWELLKSVPHGSVAGFRHDGAGVAVIQLLHWIVYRKMCGLSYHGSQTKAQLIEPPRSQKVPKTPRPYVPNQEPTPKSS
jgi:hypothetical protein